MTNQGAMPPTFEVRPDAPHLAAYRTTGLWSDRTLADQARQRAEATPDTVIFPNDPTQPTYAGVLSDAEAMARSLVDLGLKPGEVIAFQTPNWVEAAVINLAAVLGGYVISPIVTIYRDAEVRQMLGDSGARAIFFAETVRGYDHSAMLDRIAPDLPRLTYRIGVRSTEAEVSYDRLIAHGRGLSLPLPRVDPDAVKLLLYTSGTTGRAKGVLHSHNTLARVSQVSYAHWGLSEGDAILMPSPVTHISGYTNGLEQPFLTGTRTILMEAWNAQQAADLIEEHQVVGTVAATPFLQELAEVARTTGRTLPSFRVFACGGAAVPSDLVRDANTSLENPCAFRVYGSSEAPLVTLGFDGTSHPDLAAGTDGQVIDYEIRFIDDQGRYAPEGQEGEIVVRGPSMFLGYADAAQTREALTDDGFFRTGDLGRMTAEGGVIITGRKKDLIIRGGENISAKEIEDVLGAHPAVREAAVVAMPHARLGEGVCAYVVLNDGGTVSAGDLTAFVGTRGLARQKWPERIEFVNDMPRTASGKVRKDQLRARIIETLAAP